MAQRRNIPCSFLMGFKLFGLWLRFHPVPGHNHSTLFFFLLGHLIQQGHFVWAWGSLRVPKTTYSHFFGIFHRLNYVLKRNTSKQYFSTKVVLKELLMKPCRWSAEGLMPLGSCQIFVSAEVLFGPDLSRMIWSPACSQARQLDWKWGKMFPKYRFSFDITVSVKTTLKTASLTPWKQNPNKCKLLNSTLICILHFKCFIINRNRNKLEAQHGDLTAYSGYGFKV